MFIGHVAVALGGKRYAPTVPFPVLLAAAMLLDLIWPVLVLSGVEQVRIDPGNTPWAPLDFVSYPWSHSLALVLLWSVLAGGAWMLARRDARGGLVIGLAVASHWLLDFATHRPDLPLWPGGPKEGLGLWYSIPGTLVVEGALFAAGLVLYLRATRPRGRPLALWIFVAVLLASYVASMFQVPPSPQAIGIGGIVGALVLLALAVWLERTREPA